MDRLKFFSDGVFAIAITLLSLNLVVPDGTRAAGLPHQLGALWPAYAAFAFTFILIGLRWPRVGALFSHTGPFRPRSQWQGSQREGSAL